MRKKEWDQKTKVLPEETFRIWGVIIFLLTINLFRFQIKHFTIIIDCYKKDKRPLMKLVDYMMKMRNIRIF